MARKKMNVQWIANESTRRSTFKKRTSALMKKASELASLCRVKVSVVAYGEDDPTPEVYPSIPEATELLTSFNTMPDDLENWKKVMNMEDYLRGRISKLQDQKGKSDYEKREEDTSHLLHAVMAGHGPGLPGLTVEELVSLQWMVEKRMRSAEARLEQIEGHGASQEPLAPLQEQPTLSAQLQAPDTDAVMQTLAPAEEPQPQQEDLLADLAWDEVEFDPMVYSEVGITDGGAGPSTTTGGHIMQDHSMEVSDFPWLWSPFPDME